MSREWTRIGRNYLPAFRTSSTAFMSANFSRHSSQSVTWVLRSWDSSSGSSFSINLSLASETVLEFMGATDEISVHVRLEDVADVKLVFATILNEIIHVSRGVENCRFSCALVSDHVGRNGQSWNESLVKQHCSIAATAALRDHSRKNYFRFRSM